MAEHHVTEGCAQEETHAVKRQREMGVLQPVTLILLALFWIGYFYSLYRGNDSNISNYTFLIIVFSFFNQTVLFTREKAENQALNSLAKAEGVLLFVWVILTIVQLIIK